jgi:hypothetical protein
MQFLAWAQEYSPEWHAAIVERIGEAPAAGGLMGLSRSFDMLGQFPGEDASVTATSNGVLDWADKLFSFAEKAIPAYLQTKQTIAVADLNLERAREGLPPLDPQATAAQINVTHQLPPQIQTQVDRAMSTGNLLLWGGIAVAGFFLVRALK